MQRHELSTSIPLLPPAPLLDSDVVIGEHSK